MDDTGGCWLLELNSNPSLNIMFDPDDWKTKSKGNDDGVQETVVSPVDQYVKTK
jgi:hypothetical protein